MFESIDGWRSINRDNKPINYEKQLKNPGINQKTLGNPVI